MTPEADRDLPKDAGLYEYRQKILQISEENRELKRTVDRMKNTIEVLEKELDGYRKAEEETDG